ncbi:hypothetical protein STHAL_24820 [Streptomyces halstedii]|uniref:Uncharacterized protein n=1 Tax=Streptomyces halstedii TaxID=1944 RepID=A0ABS6TWN2_STRHA|nr:hypothetical protein [Streptomyces halstedii]MBV7672675.1 hypothetical protein [Streptomyces halstedii]
MPFPGELLTVFDGGTWDEGRIAEIRLPPSEITGISFVAPARPAGLLSPTDLAHPPQRLPPRLRYGARIRSRGSPMIMVTAFSLTGRHGTEPVGHSCREQAAPRMTITLTDQLPLPPAVP